MTVSKSPNAAKLELILWKVFLIANFAVGYFPIKPAGVKFSPWCWQCLWCLILAISVTFINSEFPLSFVDYSQQSLSANLVFIVRFSLLYGSDCLCRFIFLLEFHTLLRLRRYFATNLFSRSKTSSQLTKWNYLDLNWRLNAVLCLIHAVRRYSVVLYEHFCFEELHGLSWWRRATYLFIDLSSLHSHMILLLCPGIILVRFVQDIRRCFDVIQDENLAELIDYKVMLVKVHRGLLSAKSLPPEKSNLHDDVARLPSADWFPEWTEKSIKLRIRLQLFETTFGRILFLSVAMAVFSMVIYGLRSMFCLDCYSLRNSADYCSSIFFFHSVLLLCQTGQELQSEIQRCRNSLEAKLHQLTSTGKVDDESEEDALLYDLVISKLQGFVTLAFDWDWKVTGWNCFTIHNPLLLGASASIMTCGIFLSQLYLAETS